MFIKLQIYPIQYRYQWEHPSCDPDISKGEFRHFPGYEPIKDSALYVTSIYYKRSPYREVFPSMWCIVIDIDLLIKYYRPGGEYWIYVEICHNLERDHQLYVDCYLVK